MLFTCDVALDDFGPRPKFFALGTEAHGDRLSTATHLPIASAAAAAARAAVDGARNSPDGGGGGSSPAARTTPRQYRTKIKNGNAGVMLLNIAAMRRTYKEVWGDGPPVW